jgi:hypothetical protein
MPHVGRRRFFIPSGEEKRTSFIPLKQKIRQYYKKLFVLLAAAFAVVACENSEPSSVENPNEVKKVTINRPIGYNNKR